MRRTFSFISLAAAGVMMVAPAPASADNEMHRLIVPRTAAAGEKITGISGSCAGDGGASVVSDAFVGGKAEMRGEDRFGATAQLVEQTGDYDVDLFCAGRWVYSRDLTLQ